MADQKQKVDPIGRVAWMAGLALLVSLFFPVVRRTLAGFGSLTIGVPLLVAASLLGLGIYRLATRTGRMREDNGNPFAPSDNNPEPPWRDDDESEATLELFGPTLRRRYPRRTEL